MKWFSYRIFKCEFKEINVCVYKVDVYGSVGCYSYIMEYFLLRNRSEMSVYNNSMYG